MPIQPPHTNAKSILHSGVNHDGAVTSADATIALGMAAHGERDADVDISGDGRVTPLDALMIR